MLLGFAIFVIIFAIFLKYLARSIFHPSVIIGLAWGITLLLYIILDHPLWNISSQFIYVFTFWVIPFMIVSYIASTGFYYKPVKLKYELCFKNLHWKYQSKLFNRLYPWVLIFTISLILSLIYYSGGIGSDLRSFMLEKEEYPLIIRLLFIINTFTTVYTFYALFHSDKVGIQRAIILLFLILLVSFLKSAKGAIFRIAIGSFFLFYKKGRVNFIKILLGFILLIVLLISVTMFRGDATAQEDDALFRYLYIYLLSPFTALDLLINKELIPIDGTVGTASFPFLFTILNILGYDYSFTANPGWVNVPVFTNVYTAIWGFYSDFGWDGVLIASLLLGCFWGWIYKLQRKGNQTAILFYSLTCFSLVFQGFGDFFIESFSLDLQMLLYCILLTKGIKIFPQKHIKNMSK